MTRAVFLAFLLLAACGGDGGSGTGAICPTANPPTYDNFGKTFFDTYCTGCHSSSRTGANRDGAPVGRDYDTLAGVMRDLEGIDGEAAAGPDATNTSMPQGSPQPTQAQRTQLGEFIACELAK